MNIIFKGTEIKSNKTQVFLEKKISTVKGEKVFCEVKLIIKFSN